MIFSRVDFIRVIAQGILLKLVEDLKHTVAPISGFVHDKF